MEPVYIKQVSVASHNGILILVAVDATGKAWVRDQVEGSWKQWVRLDSPPAH
jgi:hypothetical protein